MSNQREDFTLSLRRRLFPILLGIFGAGVIALTLITASSGLRRSQIILIAVGVILIVAGVGLNIPVVARKVAQVAGKYTNHSDLRPQPGEIILMGIWFGLVTGLIEAVFQIVRMSLIQYIDVPSSTSIDVIWMAPVAEIVIFTVISLILALVAWSWPELVSFSVVGFVLAFIGFRTLLLMIPGLNDVGEIVLAAGLAVQIARLIKSRSSRLYRLVRQTGGWLGFFQRQQAKTGVVEASTTINQGDLPSRRQFLLSTGVTTAALALGVYGSKMLPQQIKLGQLPPSASNMPNVLLIVLDTVRAQNVSAYGYGRPTTPNLDRIGERSVRFQRAITSAPWTLPSHATMFTGRWHHELSLGWNQALDTAYPTLAEVLSQQGYLTAGFVANLDFCTEQFGLSRGFLHYEDWPVSIGQTILSTAYGRQVSNVSALREAVGFYDLLSRKNAAEITNDFLRWLPAQTERPFFAFLNYYDAHQLYLPPSPFDTQFGPRRTRNKYVYYTHAAEVESMWTMSPEEVQAEVDAYDGAIAYTDDQLGRLFAELETRGVLDNTLVIVTGDHGEQFGEHGLFGHTNSLYIQTLHVPLLVSMPSQLPTGVEVSDSISLRDLPTTILDVLELENEGRFPGASLSRYWQNTAEESNSAPDPLLSEIYPGVGGQEWYPLAKGEVKSVVLGPYHYIREADGTEELYDLDNDPLEEKDLTISEEYSETLNELRASLDNMLAST